MPILATIVPIFAVIAIGMVAKGRGLLPPEFLAAANRLVFHLAIPAMVFSAVARASLEVHFKPLVAAVTLGTMIAACVLAWLAALAVRMEPRLRGAFIEDSFHGNQGYIGLAVALYFLGPEGLARASILTGFMMILNNSLGVVVLQLHAPAGSRGVGGVEAAARMAKNPVILSALGGLLVSAAEAGLHPVLDRSLAILSGMALPLALLIIGASLSIDLMRSRLAALIGCSVIKLVLMPAIGLGAFLALGAAPEDFLPALILLATPTATVSYVLARQMHADHEFAAGAISFSTLFSALTYTGWLALGARL
ncbi:MAG: AEC family transporter [Desulfobacterales bacterium]